MAHVQPLQLLGEHRVRSGSLVFRRDALSTLLTENDIIQRYLKHPVESALLEASRYVANPMQVTCDIDK